MHDVLEVVLVLQIKSDYFYDVDYFLHMKVSKVMVSDGQNIAFHWEYVHITQIISFIWFSKTYFFKFRSLDKVL